MPRVRRDHGDGHAGVSEQIRVGRKEAKVRARTAREEQTRRLHRGISKKRQRQSSEADFAVIFEKLGLPDIAEIDAFQDELVRDYRFGSIAAPDYPAAIFDPTLKEMAKLPLGLLDEKEAALPCDLIPDGQADLMRLCRRFIIRNEDEAVINAVVAGLPGYDRAGSVLDRHVAELLRLAGQRPAVYRAVVGGQHRSALIQLRNGGLPRGLSRGDIERLLVVHGLLWCANDLQMNLARAARAERNPLDRLVGSRFRQLQPERVVNDLRPRIVLMKLLLDQYVTEEEEQGPDARIPLTVLPPGPGMRGYRSRIEAHAVAHGIDLVSLRSVLDGLVKNLRARSRDSDDPFCRILDAPADEARLPKHFSGVWFSGLSVVQCAAVTILRYMQAEHEMTGMVRAGMAMVFDGAGPPADLAMRPFSRSDLPKGWQKRAKLLLNLYRRELLDDKDYPPSEPTNNAGMAAITKAALWLERQPQRAIEDHDEKAGRDRRTLYLLDIIPEIRLAR